MMRRPSGRAGEDPQGGRVLGAALVAFVAGCAAPRTTSDWEDLRREILEMARIDQEVRRKLFIDGSPTDAGVEELERIDRVNSARMRDIVQAFGWPGRSVVGDDGAQAAWLLVQHADRDRAFQKECLRLLEDDVAKGDAPRAHLGFLTDRVRVGEGRKQVYGTQFHEVNGEQVPFPIEDEANVDQRRAEMGLPSMGEYTRSIRETFDPVGHERS